MTATPAPAFPVRYSDTQACEKFSPSRGWLMMQAEANSARQHQQAVRQHKGYEA